MYADAGVYKTTKLPLNAVAPPNKISLGPMYPTIPSSPTVGIAIDV
jgi:hypothetical protein